MVGVVISLLVAIGVAGLAHGVIFRRQLRTQPDIDPAFRIGFAGLAGLGGLGFLTFFLGISGAGFRAIVPIGLALVGYLEWYRSRLTLRLPGGGLRLFLLPIGLAGLFSLAGVLAPSTTLDWDSLAYHLAVPKLWLQMGRIEFISFIHHSNFPFTVDNLYIWGLLMGGESGAKAYSLILAAFAVIALFGFVRAQYGAVAAWWAAVSFATIPMVMWLAGTAYIDVANGAYTGLAILLTARAIANRTSFDLILAGISIGFAAASKYTGLQTAAILVAILAIYYPSTRAIGFGRIGLAMVVAVGLAAPWYARNVITTGNPVYPFFYGKLGGRNWSDYNAQIYANEQQTFGAGRPFEIVGGPAYTSQPLEPLRIGGAILGLAYQPGRYINPLPTQGQGVPMGALGFAGLLGGIAWLASGRMRRFESATLLAVGLSFGLWFFLSQQSRYIIALVYPLTALMGGAIVHLAVGRVMAILTGVQAALGLGLVSHFVAADQIKVVTGQIPAPSYRRATTSFAEPAAWINENRAGRRVALYDEVFGYLLDGPYFWANPGHTTELGYADMQTADDLVAALQRLQVQDLYVNLGMSDAKFVNRWAAAAGLTGPVTPLDPAERESLMSDLQVRWKPLLAEAIAEGKIRPVMSWGKRLLFEVAP